MHLSVVPQNRFGDLVEAALRVEQSTTAMYQSKQESKSKRSAPVTSQQSSGQYSSKFSILKFNSLIFQFHFLKFSISK